MSQKVSAANPLGTEKLILASFGDVITVLWTGPISDGGSCLISVIVLICCWKNIFKKEDAKV